MLSEHEFLEVIGDAIQKLRAKKRISCEALAGFSSVDYSTINLIENARRTPSSYTLYKILLALDIDLEDIFKEKDASKKELESRLCRRIKTLGIDDLKAFALLADYFDLSLRPHLRKAEKRKG